LARTGLIFTGLQEEAQPGSGVDPTWPNRARCSIPCDAGFRWGGRHGGNSLAAREHAAPVRSERERVCFCRVFSLSVSLLFLFPSVCCSVKLPLSRPTSFCLFLSILLHTLVGGGAAAWCFCCRRQPKPKHPVVKFLMKPNHDHSLRFPVVTYLLSE